MKGFFCERVETGFASPYLVIMLSTTIGLVSLGADWGRVQLAKTELRRAADAAARYAAATLRGGTLTAQTNAMVAAGDNLCDGVAVVLVPGDIEFGAWNSTNRTFTKLSGNALALADTARVTARRTAARGTGIPTIWAETFGFAACDVSAVSVAQFVPGGVRGFIGLDSAKFGSNLWVASYNSLFMTDPTHSTFQWRGGIGSNGKLTGRVNDEVYGTMFIGPNGSGSGMVVHGKTIELENDIEISSLPSWAPVTNPGGVPTDYTVTTNVTLPGGDYWFTSLVLDHGAIDFSGPATIHVNGDIKIGGSLVGYQLRPSNLTIYQYGTHNFTDSNSNNMILAAKVVAPYSAFDVKNSTNFKGAGLFKSFECGNYCDFYYDESLGTSGVNVDGAIGLVK